MFQSHGKNVMRSSVKLLSAGALALSVGGFSTDAQAETCFRLDPFIDVLKLEFGPTTSQHRNVYGNWVAPGLYTLPVSGALELDVLGSVTARRLGLVGTNATPSFGDNLICGFDGVSRDRYEVNCSGGTGADFQFSGTLTPISCSGLPLSSARVAGRAAGAK